MASELQWVAQALVATLDEAPRVVDYLLRTAQKYRENADYVGRMSRNPAAQLAAMQLDEAARRCEEAAHYLAQAPSKARGWAEQMVSGARTAGPAGGSPGPRRDSSDGGPPHAPPRQNDQAKHEAKGHNKVAGAGDEAGPKELPWPRMRIDEIRRISARLPARKPGDKTRGVWRDADGTEHDLVSGQHEDDFHAAQRHAERLGFVRNPHVLSTAADVELKFAMRMRREGIRHAEIILNNRPCGGRLGCNRLLKLFLPDGATLTIHAPDGFRKTYPDPDEE